MTPPTALRTSLAALAVATLTACGATATTANASTPVPVPVGTTTGSPTDADASSPAEMTRYRTQIAPHLLENSAGIDDGVKALLATPPVPQGAALAADLRQLGLDPSVQLLNDAQGYVPTGEPLTSIHAIFLASVNQKIRKYSAFVDAAASGNHDEAAVARSAAEQEAALRKDWAKKVVALPQG
jgi:hypothetical protein